MNILYLISTSGYGGAESNLLALLKLLGRRGFKRYVIAQPAGGMADDFRRESDGAIFLNLQNIFDLKAISAIRRFIKEKNIDIVHTNCFIADILGCVAAKTTGRVKLVATIHGFNFTSEEYEGRLIKAKKKLFSFIYRFIYLFFDCIIANSQAVKKDLAMRPGIRIDEGRIEQVYPLSINIPGHADKQDGNGDLTAGGKTVLTVGNFFKNKGHAVLLKALPYILKDNPGVKFVFVGDGPERSNLEAIAKEYGVSESVRFAGYSGSVPDFIKAADIVVSPSYYEGFGLTVLEALSYGKPVVAANSGGVSEIIEDGKTGVLVPAGDHRALACAVNELLFDHEKAARMGEAAKEITLNKFNNTVIVERTVDIYRRLCNGY